jgi:hypothetical protein
MRYNAGQSMEGYPPGASPVLCEHCSMQGHADRNASLVIGQRLSARYQEPLKQKPQAPVRRAGRGSKDSGVGLSQDAKRQSRPSTDDARHADGNGHGTNNTKMAKVLLIQFSPRELINRSAREGTSLDQPSSLNRNKTQTQLLTTHILSIEMMHTTVKHIEDRFTSKRANIVDNVYTWRIRRKNAVFIL